MRKKLPWPKLSAELILDWLVNLETGIRSLTMSKIAPNHTQDCWNLQMTLLFSKKAEPFYLHRSHGSLQSHARGHLSLEDNCDNSLENTRRIYNRKKDSSPAWKDSAIVKLWRDNHYVQFWSWTISYPPSDFFIQIIPSDSFCHLWSPIVPTTVFHLPQRNTGIIIWLSKRMRDLHCVSINTARFSGQKSFSCPK